MHVFPMIFDDNIKEVIKKFGKYYTKAWFYRYEQQETAEKYLVIEVTYLSSQV